MEKEKEKENAKAAGTNLSISFKHSVEIGNAVEGMEINKAIRLLEDIIAKRKPLPLKRFNKKISHKRGISAGRYPLKASKEIIMVLKNAAANAVQNNIDGDKAKIVSFVCGRAVSKERGSTRKIGRLTNVCIEVEG